MAMVDIAGVLEDWWDLDFLLDVPAIASMVELKYSR